MLLKRVKNYWLQRKDKSPHPLKGGKKSAIIINHLQLRFGLVLNSPLGARGMTLEILTPEKKIYSGDVYGVQLPGISGLFEVLDKHAPLVSALGKGNLKILIDKSSTENYKIQSGFVEVLQNKVTVLVEGATLV